MLANNAVPGAILLSHVLVWTLTSPDLAMGSHLKTQSNLRTRNWKCSPKDENEEHQQHAERGHVVHGLHEDYELALEGRHEADQLQNSHEPKGPQDREPPTLLAHYLPHAEGEKEVIAGREDKA